MIELNNLSIVITTLGNSILTQTINSFYNDLNLKCNFEIIITIPESEPLQCDLSKYKNLIVHKTKFKGQVFQRTEGFKIAKFNYVLQLDDDVEILAISIQNLISEIDKHNQDFCISPIFYDIHKYMYNTKKKGESIDSPFYYV